MCGIFAYLNIGVERSRTEILNILTQGLLRLEYRGYDSAGVAVGGIDGKPVRVFKNSGNVIDLIKMIKAESGSEGDSEKYLTHAAIAHTRWATHGEPSPENSHPHTSGGPEHEFLVVHNGIVTNYTQLKTMLSNEGVQFSTETDTEVVVKLTKHLFDQYVKENNGKKPLFKVLISEVTNLLEGAYALVFKSTHYPAMLIGTRRGSPMVLGIRTGGDADISKELHRRKLEEIVTPRSGPHSPTLSRSAISQSSAARVRVPLAKSTGGTPFKIEYFLSSDPTAIIEHTDQVVYVEDGDIIVLSDEGFSFYDSNEIDHEIKRLVKTTTLKLDEISMGDFEHFMLKEIFEQPISTVQTMRGRVNFKTYEIKLGGIHAHAEEIQRCRRIVFVACGTSYHSAVAARQFVEETTHTPVTLEIASDFNDRQVPIFRDDTVVFISQSGETADTLESLSYCRARGALCVGITNSVGSTIARTTDCGIHLNAGVEIGVASTKAFTSQVVAIILMAMQLSHDKLSLNETRKRVIDDMKRLPQVLEQALKLDDAIKALANDIKHIDSLLVMGRGRQFATALEGALKIKEISYIHTEGILSGELKHGPLALIDETMPVLFIGTRDSLYDKMHNSFQQVVARKGKPIVICTEGDERFRQMQSENSRITLLEVPDICEELQVIVNVIPLQLLSYHLAVIKGVNVDKPRNLAKSVTVQ